MPGIAGFAAVLALLNQSPYQCAVLDLQLVTADSMVALVAQPQCGPVWLVSAGSPRRVPPDVGYNVTRVFEIPVALENVGTSALPVPIAMDVDSAAPVQRGRQLPATYMWNYSGFQFWDGQETQRPWRFRSTKTGASSLQPGERSNVRLLKVNTQPVAQGIRIWFSIGAHPKPPYQPVSTPPGWHSQHPIPSGSSVAAFIAAAAFPKLRDSSLEFYDARHDVRIFTVSYGEAQDCPAGCFYSSAVGLEYGKKIGWLKLEDYDRNDGLRQHIKQKIFPLTGDDTYLLSQELADTLSALYGRYGWLGYQVLLPLVLRSPYVPRSRLVTSVEGLYAELDQSLAKLLVELPRVQSDPDLLTLLANLPNGGPPYESVRATARQQLRQMIAELMANPKTSPRTLFLTAQTLRGVGDTLLVRAMAKHPNVRQNPATLTVLAWQQPQLDLKVVASVRASGRVKDLLARYLLESRTAAQPKLGWVLLRDPEAGTNADVLTVLANRPLYVDQEVTWAASRRLPEEALKSWEYPYVPLH